MPEFKKSSGYKMKGYTYPGKSPIKQVTHGSGKDWEHGHKEKPAHQNTPEAHGVTSPTKAKRPVTQAEKDRDRFKKEEEARNKAKKKRDETSIFTGSLPNKPGYEPQPDPDKKGFDEAAKKAGLPTKKSPAKQKYDLSKATVDGKHPQTEKKKKYESVDSKDLFMQGKTRDKEGNVKDIQWAPPPKRPKYKKRPELKKSPAKQVEKDKRKGPSYSHYREGTLKALKQVNPVIQGAKLIKETSKATVKGLKERPKKNPSHTGVRKI